MSKHWTNSLNPLYSFTLSVNLINYATGSQLISLLIINLKKDKLKTKLRVNAIL